MPFVMSLAECRIEAMHPLGNVGIRRFDHEVVMIAHEAIGMAQPVVALLRFDKYLEEFKIVAIIMKYRLPSIAAGGDVIHGAGIFDA